MTLRPPKHPELKCRDLCGCACCSAHAGFLRSLNRCSEASISHMWPERSVKWVWERQKCALCAIYLCLISEDRPATEINLICNSEE